MTSVRPCRRASAHGNRTMSFKHTIGWIGLLLLSLPLAWGGRLAGFPAAFLVGPMVGAVIFSLSVQVKVRIPGAAFACVQALLGCAIARAITVSFLDSLSRNGAVMLLVVATTILAYPL